MIYTCIFVNYYFFIMIKTILKPWDDWVRSRELKLIIEYVSG